MHWPIGSFSYETKQSINSNNNNKMESIFTAYSSGKHFFMLISCDCARYAFSKALLRIYNSMQAHACIVQMFTSMLTVAHASTREHTLKLVFTGSARWRFTSDARQCWCAADVSNLQLQIGRSQFPPPLRFGLNLMLACTPRQPLVPPWGSQPRSGTTADPVLI